MWNIAGIEPEEIDYSTLTITVPAIRCGRKSSNPPTISTSSPKIPIPRYGAYLSRRHGEILQDRRGYAALRNVETKEKVDDMESYFLAETLKYLYLIFAPPTTVDLNRSSQHRSASDPL